MSSKELQERLGKVFNDVFAGRIAADDPTMRNKEQAWGSMLHVGLIIALEQEFGLRFGGADSAEMTTVAKIEVALKKRLGIADEE